MIRTGIATLLMPLFERECGIRGLDTHISVGGLDSITLFKFINEYCQYDVPGISVSCLEDKSIQAVHKQLGIEEAFL